MHHHFGLVTRVGLALGLAAGLAACTGPAKTASTQPAGPQVIYYPEAPAPPRYQFLLSFSDARAFTSPTASGKSFSDWVVGSNSEQLAATGIDAPYSLAVYQGRLYITDIGRHCVHVIDVPNKIYTTLGPADKFSNPVNVVVDHAGNKYVCDTGRRLVVVFDAQDHFVKELGDPERCVPRSVAIVGDELYVCNELADVIEVWDQAGNVRRTFGRKGQGPDEFTLPTFIAAGPDGKLYISDMMLATVKVYDTQGRFVGTVGRPGDVIGTFARPKGVAVDSQGLVYVVDSQWSVVEIFQPDGQTLLAFGAPGGDPWNLGMPAGVTIDRSCLDLFRSYIDPHFDAQYLVFVVNQFGKAKVSLFAYGRANNVDPKAYDVDMEEVRKAQEKLQAQIKAQKSENATAPPDMVPQETVPSADNMTPVGP